MTSSFLDFTLVFTTTRVRRDFLPWFYSWVCLPTTREHPKATVCPGGPLALSRLSPAGITAPRDSRPAPIISSVSQILTSCVIDLERVLASHTLLAFHSQTHSHEAMDCLLVMLYTGGRGSGCQSKDGVGLDDCVRI